MDNSPRRRYTSTHDMQPYLEVVHSFADSTIDAATFERRFLNLHREQTGFDPPGMDTVMENLFWAVEDYVESDDLRRPGELDADQFRARVAELEPELVARFEEARRREAEAPHP